MTRVHLDHNATTPMRPEVRAHLLHVLDTLGGNPSSVHRAGRAARAILDEARARAAAALRVHEDEIVFTSGGTESVNLALLGAARARREHGAMITNAAEHSAVLGAADEIAARGWTVTRVGVDRACRVDPDEIAGLVAAGGVDLVSVMTANNEVGTLQPIAAIGAGLARRGRERPLFHTDAAQALGRVQLDLAAWHVDLASFSVHKVGGPLGVGILTKRKGVALRGPLFGGGQEGGVRPGTENVPAISAAALALEAAVREQAAFAVTSRALSLQLWSEVQQSLDDVELLGPPIDSDERLPNTLNLSFGGVDGRMLVARLDLEGLEASAGSACASGSLEPSHVLLAMGLAPERARSGLRLSLGRATTPQDVHMAVDILRRSVSALR
ncbi:MAG TPA: cysteine desulfurase family protein [Planctomycetota bacterium]|jgi:cysteine desulfurase|nr:cysteine desulfurase family protein [Planctomycetota bacterium]